MARFTVNYAFAEQMKRDPKVRVVLEARTQAALVRSRQIAAQYRDTGDYEESLVAEGNTLATTDFAGHIIEWGGANMSPRGILRKAAEQVGGRVVDRG